MGFWWDLSILIDFLHLPILAVLILGMVWIGLNEHFSFRKKLWSLAVILFLVGGLRLVVGGCVITKLSTYLKNVGNVQHCYKALNCVDVYKLVPLYQAIMLAVLLFALLAMGLVKLMKKLPN